MNHARFEDTPTLPPRAGMPAEHTNRPDVPPTRGYLRGFFPLPSQKTCSFEPGGKDETCSGRARRSCVKTLTIASSLASSWLEARGFHDLALSLRPRSGLQPLQGKAF